nr:flap endonuclease gen like 1 [Quercus suber]
MGIHGLFKNLGPPPRQSLAAISNCHFITNGRPFRLAIDISIWLFQIQSGKGGSNPALRTFYYRLLRLLTLDIHPLFVFDGPNKPLFKRNKKVGGPGARVASVPEFLAKQLLKHIGFPWHVAPGEAEAECALLQREGVVDAVLSEDVDTLMFGSGVTLRNWAAEAGKSCKTPTHVDVYRTDETKRRSGIDREGMILVALMSGGDYLPEGISGCGPKVACDAARAGFGKSLCALDRKDKLGMKLWKETLEHEIQTNESKFFSRKNSGFRIPEDFPNQEVLGYYTHPCVSTSEKVVHLKDSTRWDLEIDFLALRSFTSDAFDWRCLGGAKKFIRNLAPAMLVRELRLKGEFEQAELDLGTKEEREKLMITAIHGKRNHSTTDGALEYRISFTPLNLVPIDLSAEDEDDEHVPAGGTAVDSDDESDNGAILLDTAANTTKAQSEGPISPTKKPRSMKPYDPSQPEKTWILKSSLQVGCPLLVELYEASFHDPKLFLKARRDARAATKRADTLRGVPKPRSRTKKPDDMPHNALMAFAKVSKGVPRAKRNESGSSEGADFRRYPPLEPLASCETPEELNLCGYDNESSRTAWPSPAAQSCTNVTQSRQTRSPLPRIRQYTRADPCEIPKWKKRQCPQIVSPAPSQKSITSFLSPSPRKGDQSHLGLDIREVIDLISSSPAFYRPSTPTPPNIRHNFVRSPALALPPPAFESSRIEWTPGKLPDTITKRRKKGPLRRHKTAPVQGREDDVFTDDDLPKTVTWNEPNQNRNVPENAAGEVAVDARSSPPDRQYSDKIEHEKPSALLIGLDDRNATNNLCSAPMITKQLASLPSTSHLHSESSAGRARSCLENHQDGKSTVPQDRTIPPKRSSVVAKKKHIILRDSLPGGWKETDLQEIDLTGDGAGNTNRLGLRGARRGWRVSAVSVVDMTET